MTHNRGRGRPKIGDTRIKDSWKDTPIKEEKIVLRLETWLLAKLDVIAEGKHKGNRSEALRKMIEDAEY